MQVQPYLCFEGRCQEAVDFYQQALGAQVVMLMRVSEAPPMPAGALEGGCPGNFPPDKIMHACLKIGTSEILMSDGMNTGHTEFKGITLSVSVDNDEQVRTRFQALSEGGQVLMDLHQTFFASLWGVCADKFGVTWMVLAPVPVTA